MDLLRLRPSRPVEFRLLTAYGNVTEDVAGLIVVGAPLGPAGLPFRLVLPAAMDGQLLRGGCRRTAAGTLQPPPGRERWRVVLLKDGRDAPERFILRPVATS